MTVVTYDYLGNNITRSWLPDLVSDGNINYTVFNISKSNRRIINKVHTNHNRVIWRAPSNEIENYSDTHCFGKTFAQNQSLWRNALCLLLTYNMNIKWIIPIFTGVTEMTIDSGEIVIILFWKGSFFGNIIYKSPINQINANILE